MSDIVEQKKPIRLKPKQKKTIEYWLDPDSETYGNLYRSGVKAGFRPKYALNLTSRKPLWLFETVESTLKLEPEHIITGVQKLATNPNVNSRSPADTNLKAYELLGRYSGLDNNGKGNTTNIVVQPILNSQSMKHVDVEIEKEEENKNK